MKEIHCKNCDYCFSKDVRLGAGMFYMNPSHPLEIYHEIRKCPSCGMFNEFTIVLDLTVKVKILDRPELTSLGSTGANVIFIKTKDLYSG